MFDAAAFCLLVGCTSTSASTPTAMIAAITLIAKNLRVPCDFLFISPPWSVFRFDL
jgi:hypothetical protein